MDNSHAAGTGIGTIIGIYKGLTGFMFAFLTWQAMFDIIVAAFIGGVIGWCGTEFMKLLKKKFFTKDSSK